MRALAPVLLLALVLVLLAPLAVRAEQAVSSGDRALLKQVQELFDQDAWPAARDLLKQRLGQGGEPPAVLLQALGNALYMTDDLDGAYQAYSRALQMEPDNPSTCRNLALTAYGLERWAESAELLERAHSLAGPEPDADLLFQAATAWSLGENHQAAARVMDKAWPLIGKPGLKWLKLNAYVRTKAGQHESGIAAILKALDADPDNQKLWLLLSDAETLGEQYGRAAAALEAALRSGPGRDETGRNLPDRLVGLYAGANLPFLAARSLEHEAGRPETLDRLAQLYIRAGRLDPALNALERAQRQAPSVERTKRMALLCYGFGRHRQAADLLADYLSQRPGDHDARILLAQAALSLKDAATARTALEAIPEDSRHYGAAQEMIQLLEE